MAAVLEQDERVMTKEQHSVLQNKYATVALDAMHPPMRHSIVLTLDQNIAARVFANDNHVCNYCEKYL
jgi:hypothetical protein